MIRLPHGRRSFPEGIRDQPGGMWRGTVRMQAFIRGQKQESAAGLILTNNHCPHACECALRLSFSSVPIRRLAWRFRCTGHRCRICCPSRQPCCMTWGALGDRAASAIGEAFACASSKRASRKGRTCQRSCVAETRSRRVVAREDRIVDETRADAPSRTVSQPEPGRCPARSENLPMHDSLAEMRRLLHSWVSGCSAVW